MTLAKTTETFIKHANIVHNNKYNYSKTIYKNNRDKVIITCNLHGDFAKIPFSHLQGQGCPKCGIFKRSELRKLSHDEFLEKAKQVHGDKYDYSSVLYVNAQEKIKIKCPLHGYFEQMPSTHLRGGECLQCGHDKTGNSLKNTVEDFITLSNKIHNNKYDYSKVKYINNDTKITIVCPKHGDFEQTPRGHISKKGCWKCKASKGELAIKDILKKHNIEAQPQYNIPEIVANYEIDFYLPEYRLLIEFHGIQHYEYIPFFHDGSYTFEDQKRRDELVRDAAIRWKYNYLEFNYKQYKHLSKDQFEELVIGNINKYKKINGSCG